MKQRIVVETVNSDNDDDATTVLLKHTGKRVGKFWGSDVFFSTVMGVREIKCECLWEIQFNNGERERF